MSLQILPIAKALRRHRAAVSLIVIEIAAAMAILCNVIYLVVGYMELAGTGTGIEEADLAVIQSIGVVGPKGESFSHSMSALQAVPQIVSAAFGTLPLWGSERMPVFTGKDQRIPVARAYSFFGSQALDRTLGVRIVAGHALPDGELPDANKISADTQFPILITEPLAQRLAGGNDAALGRLLYVTDPFFGLIQTRVVGVVAHLRGALTGHADDDYSYIVEIHLSDQDLGGGYVIRSRPGQIRAALQAARLKLNRPGSAHVEGLVATLPDLRDQHLAGARANAGMLVAIVAILALVTVCGLLGLASFWVQQRRSTIGIRRALGANSGDILSYYHVENALVVGAGVVVGAVLAIGLNLLLVSSYELPRLPLQYLLVGAAVLFVLGQLAVHGPARRAAGVLPVVALRPD